MNIYKQALVLNAGADSPGCATLATLSSPAVEIGVQKFISFDAKYNITIQNPLSGKAEESVAGVASPGESSSPCDLQHFSLLRFPDLILRMTNF